jgi:hypothetical protein
LSLGLTGSMFIFLWVYDELSFDRFNKLGDRLYKVEEDQPYTNGIFHVGVTPWPAGPYSGQRSRELGLRKVLVASGTSIFSLISGEFLELLLLASLIA